MFNGHKWWHKVARTGSYNDLNDKPVIYKCEHGKVSISIVGNNDNWINITKPTGWTKIIGFAFSPQPMSKWDTYLIGSETTYGDDGNMSQQFHAIGSTTQDYNIHYTIIGY